MAGSCRGCGGVGVQRWVTDRRVEQAGCPPPLSVDACHRERSKDAAMRNRQNAGSMRRKSRFKMSAAYTGFNSRPISTIAARSRLMLQENGVRVLTGLVGN